MLLVTDPVLPVVITVPDVGRVMVVVPDVVNVTACPPLNASEDPAAPTLVME
jgi:hypothetical protein